MADETTTAGTQEPDPQGGDAQGATGTAGGADDGGNAGGEPRESLEDKLERLERFRDQALAEKTNRATEQQRLADLEQENARLKSGYGVTPATPANPYAEQLAELQQQIAALQASGDPRDRLLAATIIRQEQVTQQMHKRFEDTQRLAAIPPSEQADVMKVYQTGRYADPEAAHLALKGQRWEASQKDIAEREARLKKSEDQRKAGVVQSSARPVTATELKNGEISHDEYLRLIERSEKGDKEARKRLDDVDYGRIKIKSRAG